MNAAVQIHFTGGEVLHIDAPSDVLAGVLFENIKHSLLAGNPKVEEIIQADTGVRYVIVLANVTHLALT